MEMTQHKIFNFFSTVGSGDKKSDLIVKTGQYEDGSAKIEICNLQNTLVLEATVCCNNRGLDSNDAVLVSDDKMPGLMSFLETHNIVKQQNEYMSIGDEFHSVVKLLPEDEWITDVEKSKLFIINEHTILAQDAHQAFQLYLFALQADHQTIEY